MEFHEKEGISVERDDEERAAQGEHGERFGGRMRSVRTMSTVRGRPGSLRARSSSAYDQPTRVAGPEAVRPIECERDGAGFGGRVDDGDGERLAVGGERGGDVERSGNRRRA